MPRLVDLYLQKLNQKYPSTSNIDDLKSRLEYLVSPVVVPLEREAFERVQMAIQKIYEHSQSDQYLESIQKDLSEDEIQVLRSQAKNHSVLMGYDFHYDLNTKQLSLIEINTNAAAFLLVENLYDTFNFKFNDQNLHESELKNSLLKLRQSFQKEASFFQSRSNLKASIIDENIVAQKMYPEFCMYNDLFKSWGWSSSICEYNDAQVAESQFIYNRYTDFTLSQPKSAQLKSMFLDGRAIFSPNPKEYVRLADKSRFLQMYKDQVSEVILPTELVKAENAESLWENRKKLFFKPKNMFGSKATYRGSSISRKYFENLLNSNFIAQEFRPAGELNGWKFDLRFYAYQNEIQLYCARLYNGQVTNFSTLGGGLARVQIV